jgi:uncharacterized cupin superfamily protein
MEKFHIILAEAVARLSTETQRHFTVMLKHGSMSIEYFSPQKIDTQTPHKQDEIYVIAKGSGTFNGNGESVSFNTGDVLFVPAVWSTVLKTLRKTLQPGLFFMEKRAEKIRESAIVNKMLYIFMSHDSRLTTTLSTFPLTLSLLLLPVIQS